MIDFMIIGLPRSGTTWVTNLLNTSEVFCKHDPLNQVHYTKLDYLYGSVKPVNGISCTALWRWPEWVNLHPAKKLVIHRNIEEVEASLHEINKRTDLSGHEALSDINGIHISFEMLFSEELWANQLWPQLTNGLPFDSVRFKELVAMEMQPVFDKLEVDTNLQFQLWNELEKGR